jgi:hypothetical protein
LSGVGRGKHRKLVSCIAMATGSSGPFPGGLGMDSDFVPDHEAEKKKIYK